MKTFVFVILFFSFLCHTKYRTIKGGRGKTKEKFPSDAHLKILHLPILSSEAIGNLISVQSISSVTEIKIFWFMRNLF